MTKGERPTFFATPAKLRAWFEKHHATREELILGYYKRGTGKPSVTWPESVDEALCFGWIDGRRWSVDDEVYAIRFTRRRARSIWSAVNLRRAKELTKSGRMTAAGLAALAGVDEARSQRYSYERKEAALSREETAAFEANAKAWADFQARPAWYCKAAVWWVISPKKEETRARRFATLVADSARGATIKPLTAPSGSKKKMR
jgi:uncharacterized protein YdeI (YjbR/CyaY-like superfamily)